MRVAGADGCRGGWIVATLTSTARGVPRVHGVHFSATLTEPVRAVRVGELAALGVDMPIGLPERVARTSDVALRARLGPRRASVFATPARAVLGCTDHRAASAANRDALGAGLSIQAWNLVPKIRELDALLGPDDQPAVTEVHPETTFAVLHGAPLTTRKLTPEGRAERLAVLRAHLHGLDALDTRALPVADVLDALAAAVTAHRVAQGRAEWFGDPAARDARGLRMVVAA